MGEAAAAGISTAGNLAATGMTNQANAQQASQAQAFSERMSNTAYQRSTADMKAAGINPILAFSQGGASSPVGQQATMQTPDVGKIGESIISTAFEKKRMEAEVASRNQDTLLKGAATLTETERAKKEQFSAKSEQLLSEALEANQPAALKEAQVRDKAAKTDLDHSTLSNITRKVGENLGNLNPFKGILSPMPKGNTRGRQDIH
jgi:hypothetical protein